MTGLDGLLVVQEHDTAIDQLRHRRANLAERAQLGRVQQELAEVAAWTDKMRAGRDDVAGRQDTVEAELTSLESRLAQLERRMYSGAVTIPRELQAMQADADSMHRRQSVLEDHVLEAMGEREPLEAELERLAAQRSDLESQADELRHAIAAAEAEIDHETERQQAERRTAAMSIPPELITLYEELRSKLQGVGAARLVKGSCAGCHLALPATEIDRIRREPPEAVIRCDNCGRILVR